MRRGIVATAAALLAITFAGAGLFAGQQGASAASASVSISNLAYSPATININVGDTVTWTNNEASNIPHTVTSDSGSELGSPLFGPGLTYSHTFSTAGTFAYTCTVHPTMHGTVVVAAAASGATTTAAPTTAAATTAPASAVPTTAAGGTSTSAAVASTTAAAPATGSGTAGGNGQSAMFFFGLAGVAGAISATAASAAVAVRRRR
jgi:plastocyanin